MDREVKMEKGGSLDSDINYISKTSMCLISLNLLDSRISINFKTKYHLLISRAYVLNQDYTLQIVLDFIFIFA